MAKKLVVKLKRERNSEFVAMRFRKSGAHGKTKKAERRGNKVAFIKNLHNAD